MAVVDIIIVGIMVISSLFSLIRGFVKEAISLATWAAAFGASLYFYKDMSKLLSPYIQTPSLKMAAGFAGIFILVLIAGGIVNFIIGMLVEKTGLSATDRVIGLAFGAVRGFLIVTVLIMLAGLTPMPQDPWYKKSVLIPHFKSTAEMVKGYLPPDLAKYYSF